MHFVKSSQVCPMPAVDRSAAVRAHDSCSDPTHACHTCTRRLDQGTQRASNYESQRVRMCHVYRKTDAQVITSCEYTSTAHGLDDEAPVCLTKGRKFGCVCAANTLGPKTTMTMKAKK